MLSRSLMRYIYCVYIALRTLYAHNHSLCVQVLSEIATPTMKILCLNAPVSTVSCPLRLEVSSPLRQEGRNFISFAPARSTGVNLLDNHISEFRVYQCRINRIGVRIRALQTQGEFCVKPLPISRIGIFLFVVAIVL